MSLFASLAKDAAEITLDSRLLHYGELRVVGASDSRPEHVTQAVRLLEEKRIDVTSVVTHRVNLSDLHLGIELMKTRASLKVVVYPNGG